MRGDPAPSTLHRTSIQHSAPRTQQMVMINQVVTPWEEKPWSASILTLKSYDESCRTVSFKGDHREMCRTAVLCLWSRFRALRTARAYPSDDRGKTQ